MGFIHPKHLCIVWQPQKKYVVSQKDAGLTFYEVSYRNFQTKAHDDLEQHLSNMIDIYLYI